VSSPRAPHVRRPAPAVYRRRRLAAVLALGVLLLVFLLVIRSCGEEGSPPQFTAAEVRRAELAENPVELTLSFSGDLLIHTPLFARALELGGGERYDFEPMLAEIAPYVADADLAFCHVETPMTPDPPTSYPIFNTPPALAEGIAATGWDACDTASNHTLDQGEEGVAETLEALDRAGVRHTGSATSEREARRPLILESGGARVAYLAYTSDLNGIPLPKAYMVNLFDPERIIADAKRARKKGADAVIANLHWASEVAPEYVPEPNDAQQDLVARLAREPAITAIVGQGPHIAQPIAEVKGKTVVFSEGNLISNQGADFGLAPGSQDGYIALLDLVVDGEGARVTGARYVPTWTDHSDYRVLPVGDAYADGEADPASLEASYERTVDIVGRDPAPPEPSHLR
jgi:poly-gamma-glutamate capsule biosynthesis protein CapA/YwtB (metallophosphatase superfamily)